MYVAIVLDVCALHTYAVFGHNIIHTHAKTFKQKESKENAKVAIVSSAKSSAYYTHQPTANGPAQQ